MEQPPAIAAACRPGGHRPLLPGPRLGSEFVRLHLSRELGSRRQFTCFTKFARPPVSAPAGTARASASAALTGTVEVPNWRKPVIKPRWELGFPNGLSAHCFQVGCATIKLVKLRWAPESLELPFTIASG